MSGMNVSMGTYGIEYTGSASAANTANASLSYQNKVQAAKTGQMEGISDTQLRRMKRTGAVECSTCASRQYQDGSDEGDVSFKAPGHIDPSASAGKVMAHEQEHVANAYEKAAKGNGRVMSANVSLKTAICPECGRSYVSGGVTHTTISYSKDAYGQNRKSYEAEAV